MQSNPLQTLGDALALARQLMLELADAQTLLCSLAGVNRASLLAFPERALPSELATFVTDALVRRAAGEPVAYILGYQEFWSLPFRVSPAVLIPRADSELLVALALELGDSAAPLRVLDLGTGSGAIAAALAHERPHWQIHAVDRSPAALEMAERNVRALALTNVHLLLGSWYEPVTGQFDLIISNPPYVDGDDPHLAVGDLRFEPRAALTPGADGLADLQQIISGAFSYLKAGGWLLLEHGHQQAGAVRKLLIDNLFFEVRSALDLASIERVSFGRRASGQN